MLSKGPRHETFIHIQLQKKKKGIIGFKKKKIPLFSIGFKLQYVSPVDHFVVEVHCPQALQAVYISKSW